MPTNQKERETKETDKAEQARKDYLYQMTAEQVTEGFSLGPPSTRFKEWLKNIPDDGWDIARKLERERDEAREKVSLEGFREMGRQTVEAYDQRDAARSQLDQLKQSILDLSHPNMKLLLDDNNRLKARLDKIEWVAAGLKVGADVGLAGLRQVMTHLRHANLVSPDGRQAINILKDAIERYESYKSETR